MKFKTMNKCYSLFFVTLLFAFTSSTAQENDYLNGIKEELKKEWPKNRTVNLVFHGHSVPTGYFKTPEVRTFESYPFLVLKKLKAQYPNAVINVIITSIGGENSTGGQKRFKNEVLNHKPDVLFIDYALNDRRIGLDQAGKNLEKMIGQALKKGMKIILMTPSPDLNVNLLNPDNELELFTQQIKSIADKYKIGIVDSYGLFKQLLEQGKDLKNFMAQSNHPNEKGHQVIADGIMNYFK